MAEIKLGTLADMYVFCQKAVEIFEKKERFAKEQQSPVILKDDEIKIISKTLKDYDRLLSMMTKEV